MECKLCQIIKEKPNQVIYEDDTCMAILPSEGLAPAHIKVFPKQHCPILEQLPNKTITRLYEVANKLSMVIFEGLGMQGTNIILKNGVASQQKIPHVSLDIIPRKQDDGLDLAWQPKQLSEEDMDTAFLKIKKETENFHPDLFKQEEKAPPQEIQTEKKENLSGRENYLIKQLKRIP